MNIGSLACVGLTFFYIMKVFFFADRYCGSIRVSFTI